MSLILDALRKLEREKTAAEPGVLVVGGMPWQGVRPRRRGLTLALAGLVVIGGIALAAAWWAKRPARATPPASTATAGTFPRASARPAAPRQTPSATASELPRPIAPSPRRLSLPDSPGATLPAPAAPAPRREPQLNAISRQDGRPVAVIDGRLVHEGDSIEGVHVLRIGETEVEVEVRGRRLTLRF